MQCTHLSVCSSYLLFSWLFALCSIEILPVWRPHVGLLAFQLLFTTHDNWSQNDSMHWLYYNYTILTSLVLIFCCLTSVGAWNRTPKIPPSIQQGSIVNLLWCHCDPTLRQPNTLMVEWCWLLSITYMSRIKHWVFPLKVSLPTSGQLRGEKTICLLCSHLSASYGHGLWLHQLLAMSSACRWCNKAPLNLLQFHSVCRSQWSIDTSPQSTSSSDLC